MDGEPAANGLDGIGSVSIWGGQREDPCVAAIKLREY